MAQVTGIIFVTIQGIGQIRAKDDSTTLRTGGKTREPMYAGGVVTGFREQTQSSELECVVYDTADTKLQDFNKIVAAEIDVETDTGKLYKITNAFLSAPAELAGGDGEISLTFMGDPAIEV